MSNVLPGISTNLPPETSMVLPTRFGTPIEKNIMLGEDKLKEVENELKKKIAIWSS